LQKGSGKKSEKMIFPKKMFEWVLKSLLIQESQNKLKVKLKYDIITYAHYWGIWIINPSWETAHFRKYNFKWNSHMMNVSDYDIENGW